MSYLDMESINVVIKIKIDMTWRDVMKLRFAGLTNLLKLKEEKIK